MSPPKLYKTNLSPAVRAVLLCAKAENLNLELIDVDLVNKGQFTQEYLKMNPQHTVPVLDDNGFIVADSHAIMVYLIEKYAKNSSLVPTDIQQKATLNHRLHFDTGFLFERGVSITRLIIYEGVKQIPQKYLDKLDEAYGIVEKFLTQNEWIAGDHLTIADFSYSTNLTTWTVLLPILPEKYPKISRWLKKIEALDYFEAINKSGIEDYVNLIKSTGYVLNV